jgi:hypothetical protein
VTTVATSRAVDARGARLLRVAEVVCFIVLPALALAYLFGQVVFAGLDVYAVHAYTGAADAILHGHNPYPGIDDPALGRGEAYVYPPLVAIVSTPLTLVPIGVAEVVVMCLLVGVVVATLAAVGVRDWRCYGLVFLWPPVLSAIQVGNVTLVMALAAALVWRFRHREKAAGISLGISFAAKLYLWPLGVWMLATKRSRAFAWTVVSAAVVLIVTWAAIRFDGLVGYPTLLKRLSELMDQWAFSVYAIALDVGVPSPLAKAGWLAFALLVLACSLVLARRGNDRGAFIVAVAAVIAFSPIVWHHYFALLLVMVAVGQPRLSLAWFTPLLMYATMDGKFIAVIGNGTTLQTAATIAVAGLTVALALRAPRSVPQRDGAPNQLLELALRKFPAVARR